MLKALQKKYEAEIECAKVNINIYLSNSVGIGEHSDVISAIDTEVEKLANATEKLDTIFKYWKKNKSKDNQIYTDWDERFQDYSEEFQDSGFTNNFGVDME